jgi:hypothetical protein
MNIGRGVGWLKSSNLIRDLATSTRHLRNKILEIVGN